MEVPIAHVPVGARTQVCFQGVPVEVVRTDTRVTARILVCTHWGCTVTWVPEHNWYQCPCHDGKFDEDGEVKVGPPQKALLEVPAALHGGMIVLGS
jgi:Rieske Fe-S protein